jgi:hypothetical protein
MGKLRRRRVRFAGEHAIFSSIHTVDYIIKDTFSHSTESLGDLFHPLHRVWPTRQCAAVISECQLSLPRNSIPMTSRRVIHDASIDESNGGIVSGITRSPVP